LEVKQLFFLFTFVVFLTAPTLLQIMQQDKDDVKISSVMEDEKEDSSYEFKEDINLFSKDDLFAHCILYLEKGDLNSGFLHLETRDFHDSPLQPPRAI